MTYPVASAPLPPYTPPPRGGSLASQWLAPGMVLAVIAGATALVHELKTDPKLEADIAKLTVTVNELEHAHKATVAELDRVKPLIQANTNAFDAFRANAENWGKSTDAIVCELGAKPASYECPDVTMLATRPGAKHPIQPSLGVPVRPLGK